MGEHIITIIRELRAQYEMMGARVVSLTLGYQEYEALKRFAEEFAHYQSPFLTGGYILWEGLPVHRHPSKEWGISVEAKGGAA